MFPLLAATVLLQVGVLHYIHDGPNWDAVAHVTRVCRINWWSTLLYVQNYVLPIVSSIVFSHLVTVSNIFNLYI